MGKDRKSSVGYWVLITLLLFVLGGSLLLNLALSSALLRSRSEADADRPADEEPDFEEVWSYGHGKTKAVRIPLEGVIMHGGEGGSLFGNGPDMVEETLARIRAATLDPDVKGLLLEVDSPGGAVTPSDEIYMALEDFRAADTNRVIVVFIRGLGASGAYYAAMAGDYIVAEPTALVGSVGVLMQTVNASGLGEKLGLKSVTIASGENKDLLNPLEKVNPRHVAMLRGVVRDLYERFCAIVLRSRNLKSRELLDGRILTARQALEAGFIDEIGYFTEAVDALEELLGVEDVKLVRYEQKTSFFDELLGRVRSPLPGIRSLVRPAAPRLLYQWNPSPF